MFKKYNLRLLSLFYKKSLLFEKKIQHNLNSQKFDKTK